MDKTSKVFLSYSRKDSKQAKALEKAMSKLKLRVWQDVQSIAAGTRWTNEIEKGIRDAGAVVVLVTPSSADSHWVTYEYAFATGARIPGVAIVIDGASVPSPVQQFQTIKFTTAKDVAKQVKIGIQEQSRGIRQEYAVKPKLIARFQDINGALCMVSHGQVPSFGIDLWVEHAPRQTCSVSFEILDLGFKDRKWNIRRNKMKTDSLREFLTDDMNSYGDIEIWVKGFGSGVGNWSTTTTLYEALIRYYSGRETTNEVRRALKQIREN